MINPYIAGPIVKNKEMFFGREDTLAYLQDMAVNNHIAVVGLRKIGKSSLLYQFAQDLNNFQPGVVPIYVDLGNAKIKSAAGLLSQIITDLHTRIMHSSRSSLESMGAFADAIDGFRDSGYHPLLCLDGIEKLTENGNEFDGDFFDAWRSLGELGKVTFVTASRQGLDKIIRPGGMVSPFFNIFLEYPLSGISDKAGVDLLTLPFHRSSRSMPRPELLETAIQLAGHYPHYLQIAGAILWEQPDIVPAQLADEFVDRARYPLKRLWATLEDGQKKALFKLVGKEIPFPPDRWKFSLSDLEKWGLAEQRLGKFVPFTGALDTLVNSNEVTLTPSVTEQLPAPDKSSISPSNSETHNLTDLLAYTAIGALILATALLVALLLPKDSYVVFVTVITIVMAFVLVGVNKITGGQFLAFVKSIVAGITRPDK